MCAILFAIKWLTEFLLCCLRRLMVNETISDLGRKWDEENKSGHCVLLDVQIFPSPLIDARIKFYFCQEMISE